MWLAFRAFALYMAAMRKKYPEQDELFENPTLWEDEWQDMPEFSHEDISPYQKIVVNFKSWDDVKRFSKLISNQHISKKTDNIWFPEAEKYSGINTAYQDDE